MLSFYTDVISSFESQYSLGYRQKVQMEDVSYLVGVIALVDAL